MAASVLSAYPLSLYIIPVTSVLFYFSVSRSRIVSQTYLGTQFWPLLQLGSVLCIRNLMHRSLTLNCSLELGPSGASSSLWSPACPRPHSYMVRLLTGACACCYLLDFLGSNHLPCPRPLYQLSRSQMLSPLPSSPFLPNQNLKGCPFQKLYFIPTLAAHPHVEYSAILGMELMYKLGYFFMKVKNEILELGYILKILCIGCSLVTLKHIKHFRELFHK